MAINNALLRQPVREHKYCQNSKAKLPFPLGTIICLCLPKELYSLFVLWVAW